MRFNGRIRRRPIEVIEKMSKALKGRKRSEESKRRIGIGGTNKAINIEVILNAIEKILKFNNNFNKKQIKSLLEDNLNFSFPLIIRRFGDTQSFWNKIEKYLGFYIPDRRGSNRGIFGLHETQILNNYEDKINYKIIRQYHIGKYILDGYIPQINTVIEVDEARHYIKNKLKIEDVVRQEKIENILKCQFLRIKDEIKND